MRRPIHALAAVAALALILAACASGKNTGLPAGPTTAPPGETCTGEVDMVNLTFEPKDCTVPAGTTVKWVNKVGGLPHTVTSEDGTPAAFDSKTVAPNAEFSFTFKTAGSYPYYCVLHSTKGSRSGMVGTIIVEEGTGTGDLGGTGTPSPTSS